MIAPRKKSSRDGFTLLELLVFTAIFAMVIGSFITILVAVTTTQATQTAASEVIEQSQVVLQQIQYNVKFARLIDMQQDVATGTLKLREPLSNSGSDPITIWAASGTIYIQQGASSTPQALTSSKVYVSNLTFTRHYSSSNLSLIAASSSPLNNFGVAQTGIDSVSFSFTMAPAGSTGGLLSQTIQSAATVATLVPSVAMIQHSKVELLNSGTNTGFTVSSTLSPVEAGDTLIVVLSGCFTGSLNSNIISDTQSHYWQLVASAQNSYSGCFNTTQVAEAYNSITNNDTVTASQYGTRSIPFSASNISMFVYEYRGLPPAAIFTYNDGISAYDGSSYNNYVYSTNGNTQNPIGPAMLDYYYGPILYLSFLNASTPEVPTVQSGFTIESTSSVSQTYVADKVLDDTGQGVGWNFSLTTPSTSIGAARFFTAAYPNNDGWIYVPGNAAFGTTNGFWVMKYEAKCYTPSYGQELGTDGMYSGENQTYDIWNDSVQSCLYNGQFQGFVDTAPYGYPITDISHDMAATYCASIGAHLLTNDEWMTIADNAAGVGSNWTGGVVGAGAIYNGQSYGSPNQVLQQTPNDQQDDHTNGNDAYGYILETASTTISRRTLTLSNGQVIWDMAGNIWEEVQRSSNGVGDNTSTITMPSCSTGSAGEWCQYGTGLSPYITSYNDATLNSTIIAPPNASWNSVEGTGALYTIATTTDNTIVRGGMFNTASSSGIFATSFKNDADASDIDTGFRCAE